MKTQYLLPLSAFVVVALSNATACSDSGNTGGAGTGTGTGTGTTATTGTQATVTTGSNTTGSTTGTGSTTASGSTSTGMGFPTPPTLGMQIDRMGRPAVNTALNHTFDPTAATKTMAKDQYNQDTNKATWVATYSAEFEKNLAILDGADRTCGNQVFYDGTHTLPGSGNPSNAPNSYSTLAGALADDQLYVNTAGAACTTYLAVEANATMLLPNTDCGGRTLTYNTIDETYALVIVGGLTGPKNGIGADADTQNTTFPYIHDPH